MTRPWAGAVWAALLKPFRKSPAAPRAGRPPAIVEPPPTAGVSAAHGVDLVGRQIAERLWKLAFGTSSEARHSAAVDVHVRENIVAVLRVDTLDPKYFPLRPALMMQLLAAVNDPGTASDKLSRMVAHDPVLSADVLRLANSSLHRTTTTPIETIQRAIVVCGVDALRGMLAAAMMRPVFRATSRNFPRLPRMLWERTERASRAAELYALETRPEERFESQLAVLLSALGPLVVYSAAMDVYGRNPHVAPTGDLCVELIRDLAPGVSVTLARNWEMSSRLLAALERSVAEPLSDALRVGELLGTLSFLESQTVISREQRLEFLARAELRVEWAESLWGT